MATIFPFTKDIEGLVEKLDTIPIDNGVPFADGFKQVLLEHDGNPWGPQATPLSKLATRLHFAGWSRKELEEAGLKPKDVENFRRKHNMKATRAGRPGNPGITPARKKGAFAAPSPSEVIQQSIHAAQAEISMQEAVIENAQAKIEKLREQLEMHQKALMAYQQ